MSRVPGRAETPAQKRIITDRLLDAWLRCPEMRLSQLIVAATGGQDIFYEEDAPLVTLVERYTVRNGPDHPSSGGKRP